MTMLRTLVIFVYSLFVSTQLYCQCPNPVSAWEIVGNVTIVCEGEAITVDNGVDGANPQSCVNKMVWDWGDGKKDTVAHYNNMQHIYTLPASGGSCPHSSGKTYDIRLTVIYNNGTSHYQIAPITVRPKPIASFTVPDTVCMSNPTINLNNTSCYADAYRWQVNPGNLTFTTEDLNFTFPSVGVYTFSLTATSPVDWGCGSSSTSKTIQVIPPPVAVGNATASSNCVPALVSLSSSGSTHFTKVTWTITPSSGWSWMPNNNANMPNPAVVFNMPGTYTIKMRLKGGFGCDDTEITLAPIVVNASPVVNWSNVPLSGCLVNGAFTFDPNSSIANAGGYSNITYQWSFPGGNPSTFAGQNPPAISYNQTGQYSVMIVATGDPSPSNPCGRDTLQQTISVTNEATVAVTHTGIPANNCGPFTVTISNNSAGGNGWQWVIIKANGQPAQTPQDYSFVQGTNAASQNPQVLFSAPGDYILKMQMLNVACGTNTSFQLPIKVLTAPKVELQSAGPLCIPVCFTPVAILAQNGNDPTTAFSWTAANTTTNGVQPPCFQYSMPGTEAIIFTGQNACGTQSDTILLQLQDKAAVVIQAYPDSLCKNGDAIMLSTNLSSPGFPSSVPNGVFDPSLAISGWNQIIVTNGVTDLNCITSDTARVFVFDPMFNPGTVTDFCDTVGVTQIVGFSPSTGINFSGGAYVSPTGEISAAVAGFGQHNVHVTYNAQVLGCVFEDDITFSVFDLPTSAITGDTIGCINAPFSFSYPLAVSPGLSFSWKFGDGTPVGTGANTTHSFQAAGNYTIELTVKNSAGCEESTTMQVNVEAPVQIMIDIVPTEACALADVQINCSVIGQNANWAVQVGDFLTLNNYLGGVIQFPSGIGDTTYTVRAAGSNACPSVAAEDQILIHPIPLANLGVSSTTICSGSTASFAHTSTGGPFDPFVFDNGNTFVAPSLPSGQAFQYFAVGGLPTTFLATLQLTNECGTDIDSVELLVLPETIQPFIQLSDTILCVGDTLSLSSFATDPNHPGALTVTYALSNGQTFNGLSADIRLDAPGQFTITQWVSDGCAWDSITRAVFVKPAPNVGLTISPDTICAGSLALLAFPADLDSSYLSFQWSVNDSIIQGGTSAQYQSTSSGWQNAKLTVVHDTTGCSAAARIDFHIRANPDPQIALTDTIGCVQLQTTFSVANHQNNWFYEWYFSDQTTDAGATVPHLFDSIGLHKAQVIATDVFGCKGSATLSGLLVNPAPNSQFTMNETFHCGNPATVELQNITTDATGARWFLNGQFLSNKTDTVVVLDQPGTYQFILKSINQFGCEDELMKTYKVYPPLSALAQIDSALCQTEYLEIQNNSTNADSVIWDFGDGNISNVFQPMHMYAMSGAYTISLIAMQDSSCADTLTVSYQILVAPSPEAGFEVHDTIANGINQGIVKITDLSSGAKVWQYQFVGENYASNDQEPVYQYTSNTFHSIVQIVTNDLGCTDTAVVDFKPLDFGGLVIPNAFMPNSITRGLHTVFQPVGVGLDEYLIEVFSPWGDRVWWSNVLENGQPTEYWDGIDKTTGQELPAGAYLWKVEASLQNIGSLKPAWDGMPIQKGSKYKSAYGTVTLIR
jgi:PKD repeat protein